MANRFTDSFNGQPYQPQQNGNLFSKWGECISNPVQFLANNSSINVPEQYRSSPEMMAKYLLSNLTGPQQNQVMQKVNMLKTMFGMR